MTQQSMIAHIMDYKASVALWSQNPSDRMAAATFLRLGDQLDALQEANDIQRRLCSIAHDTNDLLADLNSSLRELRDSQQRTNDLLEQSLEVQREHLSLEKRERILKEVLFRWTAVFTEGEGLSDPHWVVIAARTLEAYIGEWGFTTEDLQDIGEKRVLLQLQKTAKANLGRVPVALLREVEAFQVLYDWLKQNSNPEVLESLQSQKFEFPAFERPAEHKEHVAALLRNHTDNKYRGEMLTITHGDSAHASFKQASALHSLAAASREAGGVPLVALFVATQPLVGGVKSTISDWWMGNVGVGILFTDAGWTAVKAFTVAEPEVEQHWYEDSAEVAVCDDMSLSGESHQWLNRMKRFASDMHQYWTDPASVITRATEEYVAQREAAEQAWEPNKRNAINRLEHDLQLAAQRIHEYLDLHPAVERNFYPRPDSPWTTSPTRIHGFMGDVDSGSSSGAVVGSVANAVEDEQVGILEQWTRLLEDRIEPSDRVAELACYEAALEALEKHNVTLARLSRTEQRRAYSKFVRNAKKTVREAPLQVRRALQEFKDAYTAYVQACDSSYEPFVPVLPPLRPPTAEGPQWTPSDPPTWDDQPAPLWTPGVKPQPLLLQLPARPVEVLPPGRRPPLPDIISVKTAQDISYWPREYVAASATVEWLVESFSREPKYAEALIASDGEVSTDASTGQVIGKVVPLNPDNNWPVTVDNVPSEEGTRHRFPSGGSVWRGLFGEPKEWTTCRAYEQALRDWAAHIKAYDAYCIAIPEWEAATQKVAKENERILAEDYPRRLSEFQRSEEERYAQWQNACELHAAEERKRRAEWEQACTEHQETEERRKAEWDREHQLHEEREQKQITQWQHACQCHEEEEHNRLKAWITGWKEFAASLRKHANAINAFLDEHPDIEILSGKVDAENFLSNLEQRIWPECMEVAEETGHEPVVQAPSKGSDPAVLFTERNYAAAQELGKLIATMVSGSSQPKTQEAQPGAKPRGSKRSVPRKKKGKRS